MGFHTPEFFILLVLSFAAFSLTRSKRLWVLAVFDALFYLYAGVLDFSLLAAASVVSYLAGLGMATRWRKVWCVLGVGLNLLNLAFFKYYYFVLGNISKVAAVPERFWTLRVVLPIGISFYTFQLVSYIVDVYKDRIEPARSFLEFWVYISFFGQVIAGPIMRADVFLPQVKRTESYQFDLDRTKKGLLLLLVGLAKKVVIADTLAPFVDAFFSRGAGMSSVDVWVAAYLFGFQIYYDFSAYCDMALGVGKLFGFELTRNFNTPYVSQNPQEFWRRWHITLSTWVRDYLYIPMGGSRKGYVRGLVAVIAAMCISGLWHGASWTFLLWGLYHGILSAAHRVWKTVTAGKIRPSGLVRALNVFGYLQLTMVGWVFFRVTDVKALGPILGKMLSFSDLSVGPHFAEYVAVILVLYALHWVEHLALENRGQLLRWWQERIPSPVKGLVYAAVILGILLFTRPKENAFIYFQF
ncbi:MAG TPA: MBOAT family protein [Firmicutes bacterium]|nr:MBOAT family protein [Candidatus Fermentithermobacillaceae bacterium]